jgi:hypothetical protein
MARKFGSAKNEAAEPWSGRFARSEMISRNPKLTTLPQYEARAPVTASISSWSSSSSP